MSLMLRVRLTSNEYRYLRQASFLNCYRDLFSHIVQENNTYSLELDEVQADKIRDLCGAQLQIVGFDECYDLTQEGKILESLIDKFFTG